MRRYIDADALITLWNKMSVRGRTEFDQEIMVAPTIDIVYCHECKWHDIDNTGESCCMHNKGLSDLEDGSYCSWGERQTEEIRLLEIGMAMEQRSRR
jgi:hypothetical protein